jgi:hypothetical protein
MGHARRHEGPREACEIVDFDEALLDACPAQTRADLMMEAELLVGVFAPSRTPADLTRIAAQLSAGERDAEMNRAHARRLAAALKRIARSSESPNA